MRWQQGDLEAMIRSRAVVVLERGENGLRHVFGTLLRYRVLQIRLQSRRGGGFRAFGQIRVCAFHVVKQVLDPFGLQDTIMSALFSQTYATLGWLPLPEVSHTPQLPWCSVEHQQNLQFLD
jgi:hypothetical protein